MNSKLRFIGLLITVTLLISVVIIYFPTHTMPKYSNPLVVGFIIMFIITYIAFLNSQTK